MDNPIKLQSLNVWADENGVYQSNEDGTPNVEDKKLYSDIIPEWFQNLSAEDKEQISIIIQNKNN